MSKRQFKEFATEFKLLMSDRSRAIPQEHVVDTIVEVLDILGVDYVPYTTWAEKTNRTEKFINIQAYEDLEEARALAEDLEYLVKYNGISSQSDYDISIICGLLNRYKIPHKSWSSLNFDDEPIWVVNTVEEEE